MNSTSYMFSFVLGLIVVIVFIVVLNSRFHFVNNVFKTSGSTVAVISPTPEPTITAFPTQAAVAQARPTTRPTAVPTAKRYGTCEHLSASG
ncbi:hypothetical protein HYS00_00540 [Candidatus Microgenomates bacterium]|nr:hypothetical protein [Candidatus Microgenomates bacterium]